MNRLQMAQEIAERVPILAQASAAEWRDAEQLRTDFVADYPLTKIPALTLDQFVIGKGRDNRSLCYRIEWEMYTLGKIVGPNSLKFGVYYGRTKRDPAKQYRFRPRWGDTPEDALTSVKRAIVNLLRAAANGDSPAIAENPLSTMFKGKLLFLYNPDKFAPIYSEKHLAHFLKELDWSGPFKCGADMQRALMEYRATWPQLLAQPAALYMRLLYQIFGYPPAPDSRETAQPAVPFLDEAVSGADFITEMPSPPPGVSVLLASHGKPDYERRDKQRRRIGDRGEAVVVGLEKKRLLNAAKSSLADRIKHVSQEDDTAGYDILSFDEDGAPRPIEVKATTAPDLRLGFYITANELQQASKIPNYHLYFVFDAMGRKPRILALSNPDMKGPPFTMRALAFHVTHSTLEP